MHKSAPLVPAKRLVSIDRQGNNPSTDQKVRGSNPVRATVLYPETGANYVVQPVTLRATGQKGLPGQRTRLLISVTDVSSTQRGGTCP